MLCQPLKRDRHCFYRFDNTFNRDIELPFAVTLKRVHHNSRRCLQVTLTDQNRISSKFASLHNSSKRHLKASFSSIFSHHSFCQLCFSSFHYHPRRRSRFVSLTTAMDARKKINQKRRQSGGGKGRQAQGLKGRKTGNQSAGRKSGPRKSATAGRTPTKSGKPKQTIKRTATGLKVVTAKKTKPISDLRQLIKPKTTPKAKQTAIKKRLGLQSSSARERIRQGNVKSTAKMDQEVIVIRRPASTTQSTVSKNRVWRRSGTQSSAVRVMAAPQPAVPTVIIAPPSMAASSSSGRQSGTSIIVSNLNPSVTQNDILELFGDVGDVVQYQSINSSTAMVTYNHPSDANRAIQTYNNRFLDGLPMQVTLIPSPSTSSGSRNNVSQSFRRVFVSDQ